MEYLPHEVARDCILSADIDVLFLLHDVLTFGSDLFIVNLISPARWILWTEPLGNSPFAMRL